MSETVVKASYLTQEAFDRLKAELEELSGPGRTDIARKIEAAREEGDLKENGGYHAAREEQGKMEARIRQLTQLLDNAIIGETPADDGIVEPGMVVTVEMFGEEETFLLGSREIADPTLQVYSEQSPIGAAVNGKQAGDEETFLLGSREIADPTLQVYSEQSPIGAAVNGKQAGDEASYEAPNGKQIDVKILSAKPYTG